MATHKITLHKNGTMSQDKAPCTANYVSRDTARVFDNATKIAEKAGMSSIEFVTIIASSFDAIAEREKNGLVRFHLDGFTIGGIIPGSLPTADAPLDKKNALQLAVYLDDDIRLCLANEVPEIVTGLGTAKLRVDNIMDLAEPRPMNLVHGQRKFRVAGYNMVMTDEGACAYFEDPKGIVYPAVLDEAISPQLCEFHSETLLEGGDYKFVVRSRAGDQEGPLQSSFRKVKYLKVIPTHDPITAVKLTTGINGVGKVADWYIEVPTTQEELNASTITLKWQEAGVAKECNPEIDALAGGQIKMLPVADVVEVSGEPEVLVEYATPNGTVSYATQFVGA